MGLIIIVLTRDLFLLGHLTALEITRGNDGLPATAVLAPDDRQLQVVRLVNLRIFGSLADGRSRQSFLVSTLVSKKKEE